jgi:hypothetical protein
MVGPFLEGWKSGRLWPSIVHNVITHRRHATLEMDFLLDGEGWVLAVSDSPEREKPSGKLFSSFRIDTRFSPAG